MRGLNEPIPRAWMVSRICEEFGCLPSVALRELRRAPALVNEVMQLRAFAQAHHRFTHEKTEDGLDLTRGQDPMLDLVWEFTAERLNANDE